MRSLILFSLPLLLLNGVQSQVYGTTSSSEEPLVSETTTETVVQEISTDPPVLLGHGFPSETTTETVVQEIFTDTPVLLGHGFPSDGSHSRNHCEQMNCTEDEHCEEKNKVYGCFCKRGRYRINRETYDSIEFCESSTGSMSLSRCQLMEDGFPAEALHLSDRSCVGTVENGRVLFYFDNDNNICGTNLMSNGTHIIYENSIHAESDFAVGPINRKKQLNMEFSCIYEITQTLTMDVEFKPFQRVIHQPIPGRQGLYQVRMIPYMDEGFSHPYTGTADVEVTRKVYVGVFVYGVDNRQIATVIDSCWATPVNDQDHPVRWDLITSRCPNPEDKTVEVLQNGVSTNSRFSFDMFAFNSDEYDLVFLHCTIQLCLIQSNNCAAHCFPGHHHRHRRALEPHHSSSISLGPFIRTATSRVV